ncbi:AAEL013919-PA [Aedes aegypti]|uniref:AAEL013919-PA n=1 Tax=Aedes aegypti TaxID=7159 RepID=Q16HS2_AEDAE|nr:AAEL013919-PA [Aedes aegypti]
MAGSCWDGIPTCPINLSTLRTRLPDIGNWNLPHICKEAVTSQNNNSSNGVATIVGSDGTATIGSNYSNNLTTAAADAFYQPQSLGALSTLTASTTVTSCGGTSPGTATGATTTQQPLPQHYFNQVALQQQQQQQHQTNLHKFYKAHKKMPGFRGRRGWCGCLQVSVYSFR